jgi:hypothetical protein
MEDEKIATPSEGGAGDPAQTQDSEGTSQETSQSQSPESSQVETSSDDASSKKEPGRSNIDWALQRQIEKAVKKALQTNLTPYIESLQKAQPPQVPTTPSAPETPDWNDLSGWLTKKVDSMIEDRAKGELSKTAEQLGKQLEGRLKSTTRMQEARNYLVSQKDIGRDPAKLEEVQRVMEESLLVYALDHEPLEATIKAVELWRRSKANPNAPPKSHLTTVSGGAGTPGGKKELSVAELKALQNKIIGNLTIDDRDKLSKEVDSLVFGG